MKKVLAIILSILLLTCIAVPSFAAEDVQTASTLVTYDVPDSFMLCIPSQIKVGQTAEVSVPTLNLKSGRQVVVTAYGMNNDGELTLTGAHNENNTIIAYMFDRNGDLLKPGSDTVGVFGIGDESLTYEIQSSAQYESWNTAADTYQGTLYFSAYSEVI